ncbi:MAG: hypothetical protein M3Y09_19160 [Actinomycetota bacterium]|nr:hypothetical protein [Actinomycetota bacterium]
MSAVAVLLVGFASSAWADFTAVEGQQFIGQVLVAPCSAAHGTIDWGDNTMSAGTSDGGSGVDGTHTYADQGIYSGSLVYTCPQFGQTPHTASFQATVKDAPLTGSGRALTATAGQAINTVVAQVNDANPQAGAGDLSAQITWGDGATTAGSVASSAGGGFDVSGAHTYATAGNYAIGVTVTDVGGSTTTAGSSAQVKAAPPLSPPPPPPPPPPPSLPPPTFGPPRAFFTYSPAPPCGGDQVAFDASGSRGGGRRLISYRWSISPAVLDFFGHESPGVRTTTPRGYSTAIDNVDEVIGGQAPDAVVPDYLIHDPGAFVPEDHRFPTWHVQLFHRAVTMTLRVTASDGETASFKRRITFRDPVQTATVAYYYGKGGQPDGPGFTLPIGIVSTDQICDSRSLLQKVLRSTLTVRPSVLKGARGTLQVSAKSAAVTVRVPCRYAKLGCDGILAVGPSGRADAGRRPRTSSLGFAQFVVARGRGSATVNIPLTAQGRSLALAHKLGRVTLSLLSTGASGRISITTRTITLIRGPARQS